MAKAKTTLHEAYVAWVRKDLYEHVMPFDLLCDIAKQYADTKKMPSLINGTNEQKLCKTIERKTRWDAATFTAALNRALVTRLAKE